MYPWLAMGHLTSFLHLANKLAERGHQISFFIPTKTQPKLASHNHHPTLITFIPIIVPHVDGLPVGAETTNDVIAIDVFKLMDAMDLTQDIIDSHLTQLKPDYIFFDLTQWLPELAPRGIPEPEDHKITEDDLVVTPPGFPNPDLRLQRYEARVLAYITNMYFGGGMTLSERLNISFKECDVVAIKTCREMEGGYYEFLKKHMNHKSILLVGPLVPEKLRSTLDDRFDGWLNGFSHGSVVYCALGSECVLDKKQFHELVYGLELTGRPFLAALRPPRGKRGIIRGGWVQQQLILHHPSVGCFVTHCGAGSLAEAMLSECQLVLFPQTIDQYLNAKLMSMDLRVGVEVDKDEATGSLTKEAICEAVNTVMEIENKVGKEVRTNHTKLRNTLLKPGFEDSYIDEFAKSLKDMLG
ncbi:hypothetical protein RND81_06G242500 [Saponaria officinalis]|uniref:Glycosyltransferase n=1 Tax=Saponaria officinalis TaxID=3572 RepID=A0AAW1KAB3_SAPOF